MSLFLAVFVCFSSVAVADDGVKTPKLKIKNVKYPLKGVVSGGQPTKQEFLKAQSMGIKTVINLRSKGEIAKYAFEEKLLKKLAIKYIHIPVYGKKGIHKENMAKLFKALKDSPKPVLIHCASGNRVGALFALKAALVDGKSVEDAVTIGKKAGLTGLEATVRTVISKK
ncbi:MAG: sulfur transferase domain-containing protein [Planctomycetota bacterium]|nr:sulfur transferase domain-containing protein [Planctomycetota bacterium]